MTTTLIKPKQQKKRIPSHTPNYINILPPGRITAEKMSEMGIDVVELATRMEVPVETVEQLLRFEIPLTKAVAEKLEEATQMPADVMMRFEASCREKLAYAMEHPEIPAYFGTEIINQSKRTRRSKAIAG